MKRYCEDNYLHDYDDELDEELLNGGCGDKDCIFCYPKPIKDLRRLK